MHKFLKDFRKDLIIIFVIMAAFCLQHFLSFHLGINYEEGREGNAHYLAMQGDKPYRDFEWDYGPFAFSVYPSIMRIFGINLVVLRLSYILFASLVIPLVYFLSRRIMPPIWSGLAAFLAVIFFDVPYYTFNHIFAVLGELGCLLIIANGIETKRYKISLLFAGIPAAVVLLTKPFISGINLYLAVFLFLLILANRRWITIKIANAMILFFGTAFFVTALFVTFYLGGAIKNYFMESIPLFAPNPSGLIYYLGKPEISEITAIAFSRLFAVFAINRIVTVTSFNALKEALVVWFDHFIFCLPFLTPVAFFAIYKIFIKRNDEFQKILKRHRITILLFVIFSVLISTENLMVAHRMNRAFNIQATFILLVFSFFLLLNTVRKNKKAFTLFFIVVFSVFLSFLHFFRYPWSRSKKFTQRLDLARAGGVLVTAAEKELYESVSAYFSGHLSREEEIVVMGYNPQLTFLTGQKNLFEDEEGIFLKLEELTMLSIEDRSFLSKLRLVEDGIIDRIKLHKPKLILDVIYDDGTEIFYNRVTDYIGQRYVLAKTFGPAEIRGEDSGIGQVKLYTLKETNP
jgi:hypothetical protein